MILDNIIKFYEGHFDLEELTTMREKSLEITKRNYSEKDINYTDFLMNSYFDILESNYLKWKTENEKKSFRVFSKGDLK
jgi:hypothetical protein